MHRFVACTPCWVSSLTVHMVAAFALSFVPLDTPAAAFPPPLVEIRGTAPHDIREHPVIGVGGHLVPYGCQACHAKVPPSFCWIEGETCPRLRR